MATELGRRFRDASAMSLLPFKNCYRAVLRLIVTDADYRAAGVRPPAPPSRTRTAEREPRF